MSTASIFMGAFTLAVLFLAACTEMCTLENLVIEPVEMCLSYFTTTAWYPLNFVLILISVICVRYRKRSYLLLPLVSTLLPTCNASTTLLVNDTLTSLTPRANLGMRVPQVDFIIAILVVTLALMYLVFVGVLLFVAHTLEKNDVSNAHRTRRAPFDIRLAARAMFRTGSSKKRKRKYKAYQTRVQSVSSFFTDRMEGSSDERTGRVFYAVLRFFGSISYASEHPNPRQGYYSALVTFCSDLGLMRNVHKMVGSLLSGHFGTTVQSGGFTDSDTFVNIGKVLKSLREGTTMSEDIWSSPGMLKIKRVLIIVLTFYVHQEDGTDNAFIKDMLSSKLLFEPVLTNRFDMTLALGDLMLHVCETGYQYIKTGSLDVMFHGASKYQDFYDDMLWLSDRAPFLLSPTAKGFTESEFLAKLNSCVERGDSIVKRARTLKSRELRSLEKVYADLLLMQSSVLSRSFARQEREMPFAMLVNGPSSIGKTSVCNALHQLCANVMKEDNSAEFKYARNPFNEYWSGFRTECWCIQLDDVAFMRPGNTPDPSVVEFLQLLNCVPYCPNQAALSEKGRTPIRAKLVIGSTNTKELNTYAYFCEPSAVNRRFPIVITPKPRAPFKGPTGLVVPKDLDAEAFPDYWTFTLETVAASPTPRGPPIYRTVMEDASMQQMLEFVILQHEQFRGVQDKMNSCLEAYKTVEYCDTCNMPEKYCVCAGSSLLDTPQATEVRIQSQPQDGPPPMIDHSDEAWAAWWESWFTKASTSTAMVAWTGWRSITHETDAAWITITCIWVMTMYMPVYGYLRKKVTINILERHLQRTVGWVFYCWPEAKGPVAQYLYAYTTFEGDEDWSFQFISRENWGKMGRMRANALGRGAITLGIVAAVTGTAYALYRFAREASREQSSPFEGEAVSAPKPFAKERPDPWRKDNVRVVPLPASSTTKCSTPIELMARMKGSVLHFDSVVEETNKRTPGTMLGLGGSYFLVNNHCVPVGTSIIAARRIPDNGKVVGPNFSQQFAESMISRDVKRDLAIVCLKSAQPCKNILEYFPANDSFQGKCTATVMLNRSGIVGTITFKHVRRALLDCSLGSLDTFVGVPSCPTVTGDCGSPMVANSAAGPMIVGIHSLEVTGAMTATKSAATLVDRIWLDEHLATFDCVALVQSGRLNLDSTTGQKIGVTKLHRKSVMNFLESGQVDIYGSMTGVPRIRPRSNVGKTIVHDVLRADLGWLTKLCKPVMDTYEPWRLAALDLVNPVVGLDPQLLEACVHSFVSDIVSGLTPDMLQSLKRYDTFTSLNGAPGITYVNGIERGTSAGFPWGHSKAPLLVNIGEMRGCQNAIDVLPEVHERIAWFEEMYKLGERCYPVFTACLKDEPVSEKKAQTGKTRVFCAAPFDWSVVVRKYFLSMVRLQQNNTLLFEAASGTVAQSHEWGDIRRHLCKFGENNMIAGDYKAYDKRMPAMMVLAAFDVMIGIYKVAGTSEEDLRVMQTIAYDTAFPTVNFNGDLVTFHGSNPSGHSLTVQINSFANSLYMRYCYASLGGDLGEFTDNVALVTYGDDNAMGVSDRAPFFNHTAIARQLSDVDITYTMADKEAVSVPYIHIDEVTFLKRAWVYSAELGDYSCPLAKSSIHKMLLYRVESKTETEEQQLTSQIRSAHNEFFFHGRQEFDYHDAYLRNLVVDNGLTPYLDPDLPTWGEYVERWLKTSPTGVVTTSGENH